MPTRRHLIALGAVSVIAPDLVRSARANPWPDRTVHMVVPLAAGGPTDVNARVVAEQLAKIWGQQVVIDNKAVLALTSAMPSWPTPILMVTHCCLVRHPLRRMVLYTARSITVRSRTYAQSRSWRGCHFLCSCRILPRLRRSRSLSIT